MVCKNVNCSCNFVCNIVGLVLNLWSSLLCGNSLSRNECVFSKTVIVYIYVCTNNWSKLAAWLHCLSGWLYHLVGCFTTCQLGCNFRQVGCTAWQLGFTAWKHVVLPDRLVVPRGNFVVQVNSRTTAYKLFVIPECKNKITK